MGLNHSISSDPLTLDVLEKSLMGKITLTLSKEAEGKIERCRTYLDQKIATTTTSIYGINTGFGSLYNRTIPKDQLEQLQENLVMSHACGMGADVPGEVIKLMLFLKVQSLSYGHSGVHKETVQRLIDLFNSNSLPRIFEMGSLGASGDLAPLAHLTLPLIGKGEVWMEGKLISGDQCLAILGCNPLRLKAKEGLALLNGTQFMSAYSTWCIIHAHRLVRLANTIGALSLDAFDGRMEAFDSLVHNIRPHKGQIEVASTIRHLLEGSELQTQHKKHVQDPYSFRCMPQVHGASLEAIEYVARVTLTEINGVTDNPNIFPEEDKIVSAGNFHGQPLALGLDFLAIALAELGSISERRTFQLISGARELPNYLIANPGIHSGMMIPQYTAASIVSQNKQLCTPASVDSIVSSNGQEDHVSMGANAATKAYKIVNNLYSILAIELMTAAQAMHFRKPLKTSSILENFLNTFRKQVSFIEADRLLHEDMIKSEMFLKSIAVDGIEINK